MSDESLPSIVCPKCGSSRPPSMRICAVCGLEIAPDAALAPPITPDRAERTMLLESEVPPGQGKAENAVGRGFSPWLIPLIAVYAIIYVFALASFDRAPGLAALIVLADSVAVLVTSWWVVTRREKKRSEPASQWADSPVHAVRLDNAMYLESEVPSSAPTVPASGPIFLAPFWAVLVFVGYVGTCWCSIASLTHQPESLIAVLLLATMALLFSWHWILTANNRKRSGSTAGLVFWTIECLAFTMLVLIGLAIVVVLSLIILLFLYCASGAR